MVFLKTVQCYTDPAANEVKYIMKICTCEACRYTFRYPLIPPRCPDCGHGKVREANRNEIKEYHRLQKILAEEIRLGIYGAAVVG